MKQVVNLTQIQLEEAMKPIRFEGMSSQMAPRMKGSAAANGSGIPLSSSLVDASISMPNPISSLLAGEKIQFGGYCEILVFDFTLKCPESLFSPLNVPLYQLHLGIPN